MELVRVLLKVYGSHDVHRCLANLSCVGHCGQGNGGGGRVNGGEPDIW